MQKKNIEPADGTRILIVRLSAIGDVLHATAVTHNLKRIYPNCHLTWYTDGLSVIVCRKEGTVAELLSRQFGLAPVATSYLYAGKAEFAFSTTRHKPSLLVDNEMIAVRNGLSDGNITDAAAWFDYIV